MAHEEIVTLFGVDVATGFGFVFGGVATDRTTEVIEIRFFLCESG